MHANFSRSGFAFVCIAALTAASAFAATSQDECTAYLEESDTVNSSSFVYGNHWSDGDIPGTGSTNYVGAGMIIRDQGNDKAEGSPIRYPGDVLVLAGTYYGFAWGGWRIYWPELRLQNGAEYRWMGMAHVDGKIVVESDSTAPSSFNMFYPLSNNSTFLYNSFHGDEDSCFELRRSEGTPVVAVPDLRWNISGDWSGFRGTCRVCDRSLVCFYSNEHDIPGKIEVLSGGYMWMRTMDTTAVTIGSLDLRDGSHYWSRCNSDGKSFVMTVTEKLTLGGTTIKFVNDWNSVTMTESGFPKCGNDPRVPIDIPLFKLTGNAAQNVPDLTKASIPDFPAARKIGDFPQNKTLVCIDNGDGTKTIAARYYSSDMIIMKKSCGSYKPDENAFLAVGDAIAEYWEPAAIPTSETSGYVYAQKSITWTGSNTTYLYPELVFTIAPGMNMYMHSSNLTAKKFIFAGTGGIQTYSQSSPKNLYGPVELRTKDATVGISVFQKFDLTIHGDISGPGDLKVTTPIPHHNPKGITRFKGSNAGLSGIFSVESKSNDGADGKPVFPDLEKGLYIDVFIDRGDQLGGEYSGSYPWRSIRLNNYACLNVIDADVAVNESTRGFFVDGGAQLNVADGRTLTLDVPVTYGGELLKRGGGTLALGSSARFIDGDPATEPLEGTNALTVAEGTLKILSTNALNGVCVNFAEETALLVDPLPEDPSLAEYGAVNTRWNAPFTGGEEGGEIFVKIEDGPNLEGVDEFTCAICTVSAQAAEGLKFRIKAPRHFKNELSTRENADGSVTILVRCERRIGVFITVR